MTVYPYTTNIPAGGNNPSTDRPNMTENFNSTNGLIAEDHYGFNGANGGFHKQARMPALVSIPTDRIDNCGTIYVKSLGNRQLFYVNDQTTNEYQLTRVSNTNFATFSANPGWTFLPGGMLMQWGQNTSSSGATINFPFPFTTSCYSVQCTVTQNTTNRHFIYVRSFSNSSFVTTQLDSSGDAESSTFTWIAIGI